MNRVDLSPVLKSLYKLPSQVIGKLQFWVRAVELYGIQEVRKVPGFHDEPLKGKRKGQRSVRLNKAYRVIYTENKHANLILIRVEEVNKHEY